MKKLKIFLCWMLSGIFLGLFLSWFLSWGPEKQMIILIMPIAISTIVVATLTLLFYTPKSTLMAFLILMVCCYLFGSFFSQMLMAWAITNESWASDPFALSVVLNILKFEIGFWIMGFLLFIIWFYYQSFNKKTAKKLLQPQRFYYYTYCLRPLVTIITIVAVLLTFSKIGF